MSTFDPGLFAHSLASGLSLGQQARAHQDALAMQMIEEQRRQEAVVRQQAQERAAQQGLMAQIDSLHPAPPQWLDPGPAQMGEQGPPAPTVNPAYLSHQDWRQSIQGMPSKALAGIAGEFQTMDREQKMAEFNENLRQQRVQGWIDKLHSAKAATGHDYRTSPILAAATWVLNRMGYNYPMATDKLVARENIAIVAHEMGVSLDEIMPPDDETINAAQHGDRNAIGVLSSTPGGRFALGQVQLGRRNEPVNPQDIPAAMGGDPTAAARLMQTQQGRAALADARRAAEHGPTNFTAENFQKAYSWMSPSEAQGYADISNQQRRLVRPASPKGVSMPATDAADQAAEMMVRAGIGADIADPDQRRAAIESHPLFLPLANKLRLGQNLDDKFLERILGPGDGPNKLVVGIRSAQARQSAERLQVAEAAVMRFRAKKGGSKLDKDGKETVPLPSDLTGTMQRANTAHQEAVDALEAALSKSSAHPIGGRAPTGAPGGAPAAPNLGAPAPAGQPSSQTDAPASDQEKQAFRAAMQAGQIDLRQFQNVGDAAEVFIRQLRSQQR